MCVCVCGNLKHCTWKDDLVTKDAKACHPDVHAHICTRLIISEHAGTLEFGLLNLVHPTTEKQLLYKAESAPKNGAISTVRAHSLFISKGLTTVTGQEYLEHLVWLQAGM